MSVRKVRGSTLCYRWSGGTCYRDGHEFHKTTKGRQRNRSEGRPLRISSEKSNEQVAFPISDRGNHDANDGEHHSGRELSVPSRSQITDDVHEEKRRRPADHRDDDELPQRDLGPPLAKQSTSSGSPGRRNYTNRTTEARSSSTASNRASASSWTIRSTYACPYRRDSQEASALPIPITL